jgi:hypothetical protein
MRVAAVAAGADFDLVVLTTHERGMECNVPSETAMITSATVPVR